MGGEYAHTWSKVIPELRQEVVIDPDLRCPDCDGDMVVRICGPSGFERWWCGACSTESVMKSLPRD